MPGDRPEGSDILARLAFDLRSSYSHQGDRIREIVAPDLWAQTGNAWLVYQNTSRDRLRELRATPLRQGYLRQAIDAARSARPLDTRLLPVAPVRDVHGEWT